MADAQGEEDPVEGTGFAGLQAIEQVASGFFGQALEAGLSDLDGFFTFVVGTKDGFGVVRDPIACKPAVLAETEDWVAMASEFRSLADLPVPDITCA